MHQQLEDFSDLIEQLKPVVNEPDFNQILLEITKDLPKPKVFILKTEMKRIARPCTKIIDLRDEVDGPCTPVHYDELTHFLDDEAQDVFDRQTRLFGSYTVGVYETVYPTNIRGQFIRDKVQNTQKAPIRRLTAASSDEEQEPNYLVPVFQFADAEHRNEERMNFISTIEMISPSRKSIKATTIDLSVNGIKVKTMEECEYAFDDRYSVFFRGLEKEHQLDRKRGIGYRVVKYERTDIDHRIAFQRDAASPDENFDGFLQSFIHNNKKRFKVNIDNTLHAIKSKTYEQYYVPYFTSVPVYIEETRTSLKPSFILSNDNNRDALYYWTDENNKVVLSQVLSERRIRALLDNPIRETYLFCFNHVKDGKVYFYSATEEELQNARLAKNPFFGFGSRKASWRVYKLQISSVKPESQCFRPLSVPDEVSEAVEQLNQPPPQKLIGKISDVKYVLLMTNITDHTGTQAYQRRAIGQAHLTALQAFAHSKNDPITHIPMHRFKYQNLRFEVRYQLRTKAIVKWQGKVFEGVTEDVSTGGLSIELSQAFDGNKNAIVSISFPELQSVTTEHKLIALAYEIRGISKDKNVIKLMTHVPKEAKDTPHVGSVFFSDLIKTNRNKLRAENDEDETPGLGEALRNIYCSNVLNIAFFLAKDGAQFVPNAMTEPNSHHRLKNLFNFATEKEEQMNMMPLFASNPRFRNFIPESLRRLKSNSPPVMRELFISFNPKERDPKQAIRSIFSEQFKNDHGRREFIVEAIGLGHFYAIKVILSRTGRPDQEILRTELAYVSEYASHKAKRLEEELWKIAGAGDIIDITDEVIRRYGFTEQHVSQNQEGDKHIFLNAD